jgi:hypothetical protein
MRHDSENYISIRISSLGENGGFRGLDNFSALERFCAFMCFLPALALLV